MADLKALLLKTYEGTDDRDLQIYGQKFTGDANGWIFPDLFPEQFHRFLQVQLFQKKEAFFMDHDPGIEIWSVPVYKANFVINAVPGDSKSVLVQAWLFSAESVQSTEKDFIGIREAVREYDYILSGFRNANDDLVVEAGYWIKGPTGIDSRQEHPDYFVKLRDANSLQRKSRNPEIEIKLVDQILAGSY